MHDVDLVCFYTFDLLLLLFLFLFLFRLLLLLLLLLLLSLHVCANSGVRHLTDWDPAKPPEPHEPCGMVAGAVSLPKAMAVLQEMGRAIVNNSRAAP